MVELVLHCASLVFMLPYCQCPIVSFWSHTRCFTGSCRLLSVLSRASSVFLGNPRRAPSVAAAARASQERVSRICRARASEGTWIDAMSSCRIEVMFWQEPLPQAAVASREESEHDHEAAVCGDTFMARGIVRFSERPDRQDYISVIGPPFSSSPLPSIGLSKCFSPVHACCCRPLSSRSC